MALTSTLEAHVSLYRSDEKERFIELLHIVSDPGLFIDTKVNREFIVNPEYAYVWKLNTTGLEFVFWADKLNINHVLTFYRLAQPMKMKK